MAPETRLKWARVLAVVGVACLGWAILGLLGSSGPVLILALAALLLGFIASLGATAASWPLSQARGVQWTARAALAVYLMLIAALVSLVTVFRVPFS